MVALVEGEGRMAAAPGGKFNYSSGVSVKNMMCALGVLKKSAKRFMKSVRRHVLVLSVLRALF